MNHVREEQAVRLYDITDGAASLTWAGKAKDFIAVNSPELSAVDVAAILRLSPGDRLRFGQRELSATGDVIDTRRLA